MAKYYLTEKGRTIKRGVRMFLGRPHRMDILTQMRRHPYKGWDKDEIAYEIVKPYIPHRAYKYRPRKVHKKELYRDGLLGGARSHVMNIIKELRGMISQGLIVRR